MDDFVLPSGPWIGFHTCPEHGRIWHRLTIRCLGSGLEGGTLAGDRHIPLSGELGPGSRVVFRLWFSSQDVDEFVGAWDGQRIAGEWTCSLEGCGGPFQIWPYRQGGGARLDRIEAETEDFWATMSRELDRLAERERLRPMPGRESR